MIVQLHKLIVLVLLFMQLFITKGEPNFGKPSIIMFSIIHFTINIEILGKGGGMGNRRVDLSLNLVLINNKNS